MSSIPDYERRENDGSPVELQPSWTAKVRWAAIAIFWLEMLFVGWTAFFGGLFQSQVSRLLMVNDKVLHITAFAVLTLTALFLWKSTRLVVLMLVSWALAVEAIQSVIPGRESSFNDAIASTCGLLVGLMIYRAIAAYAPKAVPGVSFSPRSSPRSS